MIISLTVLFFVFIIGLCIGSFLNVVIIRSVSGESIAFPGSKCPKCQNSLKWYHNIPVLSYLFLKGKCAYCKEHISLQYPIVELFTAILFTVIFIKFCTPYDPFLGLSVFNPIHWTKIVIFLFIATIASLLIAITGTDIIEQKVDDVHIYSLIGTGIVYSIYVSIVNVVFYAKSLGMPQIDWNFILSCPVLYSLAGAIMGFLIIEAIARLGVAIVGTRSFGDGDSYIFAGLGSIFGGILASSSLYSGDFTNVVKLLVSIFVWAVVLQVIVTLPILLKKLFDEKNWITFGSIISFIVYAIIYALAQNSGLITNQIVYWLSLIIFIVLGLFTCKELLSGVKKHCESALYLPFGPALAVSGMIALLILPF